MFSDRLIVVYKKGTGYHAVFLQALDCPVFGRIKTNFSLCKGVKVDDDRTFRLNDTAKSSYFVRSVIPVINQEKERIPAEVIPET